MGSPPLVDFRRDPLVVIKKNAGVNTVIAVWSKTTAQRASEKVISVWLQTNCRGVCFQSN